MDRFLNKIYQIAGAVSAGLIIAICILVSAQVLLNIVGRMFPGLLPSTIPSYADFAGFMLAASTFLAMSYTLRSGGHIRVNLIVQRLPERATFFAEFVVLLVGIGFAGFATFYAGALVGESIHYGDVSNGIIPVPLWIPQSFMALGLGLLVLSLCHTLFDLIREGQPVLGNPDEV